MWSSLEKKSISPHSQVTPEKYTAQVAKEDPPVVSKTEGGVRGGLKPLLWLSDRVQLQSVAVGASLSIPNSSYSVSWQLQLPIDIYIHIYTHTVCACLRVCHYRTVCRVCALSASQHGRDSGGIVETARRDRDSRGRRRSRERGRRANNRKVRVRESVYVCLINENFKGIERGRER